MKFEFLEHTADIKFRAYGDTLEMAIENAVLAFAYFIGKGETIHPRKGKSITVHAKDKEELLYKFFDELIYLMDAENFVVAHAEVLLKGNNLTAHLYGDDSTKYDLDYVKAPTYSEMIIEEGKDKKWTVQTVLDV